MGNANIRAELNSIADRLRAIANELKPEAGKLSVSDMTKALDIELGRKELCYQMKVDGSSISSWIHGGGIKSSNLKKLKALYRRIFKN